MAVTSRPDIALRSHYRSALARPNPGAQRGVALAIVLWFLAAMSLMVSGIVMEARTDTHMAQMHVARAKAVAAGDGAILLFLADLVAGKIKQAEAGMPIGSEYVLGDRTVRVELVATSGLIDPRFASPKTLEALLRAAGGGEVKQAELVAGNVLRLRYKFLAIEDLLRVDGVSKTTLDTVRDMLVVGVGRNVTKSVDWASAPPDVQAVLAAVDPANGSSMGSKKKAGKLRRGEKQQNRSTGKFRVDALVQNDGQVLLRRRWVSVNRSKSGKLPWKFTRTEPVRVVVTN